jgi:hypothetical protein
MALLPSLALWIHQFSLVRLSPVGGNRVSYQLTVAGQHHHDIGHLVNGA